MDLQKLQYPIGKFDHSGEPIRSKVAEWIGDIANLPGELRLAISGLSEEQLDTPYRPQGWTVRQVVHHIADSHLNSYLRCKWALTEERPTIKAYFEERWAELPDYREVPLPMSLSFIELLHQRWVILLKSLTPEQLAREFLHPESGPVTLARNTGVYAWHGKHHLAHITSLRARMGW